MDVSINGCTPKWMDHKGKSQSQMDAFGGTPILENLHIIIQNHTSVVARFYGFYGVFRTKEMDSRLVTMGFVWQPLNGTDQAMP